MELAKQPVVFWSSGSFPHRLQIGIALIYRSVRSQSSMKEENMQASLKSSVFLQYETGKSPHRIILSPSEAPDTRHARGEAYVRGQNIS